jgi:hypothetical protein
MSGTTTILGTATLNGTQPMISTIGQVTLNGTQPPTVGITNFLNNPDDPTMGYGWRPRAQVVVAGVAITNTLSVEIVSNSYFQADHLILKVVSQVWDVNNQPPTWWVNLIKPIIVDVYIGSLPDNVVEPTSGPQPPLQNSTRIFRGQLDRLDWDVDTSLMTCTGRDLSSLLMDKKIELTFQNLTSSQVAQKFATENNLTAVVTATRYPIGRYYQEEHTRIQQSQFVRTTTEWDLLVYLARQEGYAVWVDGNNLHFEPPENYDSLPKYLVKYEPGNGVRPDVCNVMNCSVSWALNLAKDIRVVVKSFNAQHEAAFTRSYGKTTGSSAQTSVQTYEVVRPGLTYDQALALAQQIYGEMVAHERVLTFHMPGELTMTPRYRVTLQGTGTGTTGFDQDYNIDEIRRTISFDGGFVQYIRAKNHSTLSQVNVG